MASAGTLLRQIEISKAAQAPLKDPKVLQQAKTYLAQQAASLNDKQFIAEVIKSKKIRSILPKNKRIDLMALDELSSNFELSLYQGLENALRTIQKMNLPLENGTYYNLSDGEITQELVDAIKQFNDCIVGIMDMYNSNPSFQAGYANNASWKNLFSRFETKEHKLRKFSGAIFQGSITKKEVNTFLNQIKGKGGTGVAFGRAYGFVMEDMLQKMLSSPEGRAYIEGAVKKRYQGTITSVTNGGKNAKSGTIRGSSVSVSFEGDVLTFTGKGTSKGNPLRDIEFTMTKNGTGQIKLDSIGITSKRYNVYSSSLTHISLGDLTLDKFAKVFLDFNPTSSDAEGKYSLYLYREIANKDVPNYLFSRTLGEIVFGTGVTRNDVSELMVINGVLMNTVDVISNNEVELSSYIYNAKNFLADWIPGDQGPSAALAHINAVHAAKLHVQLAVKQIK